MAPPKIRGILTTRATWIASEKKLWFFFDILIVLPAMWSAEQIKATLEKQFEDSKVVVDDLTGTSDHFQVTIVSDDFEGLAPIERHRKVYAALGPDVGGAIHALSIKAYTNTQWLSMSQGLSGPQKI